MKNISHIKNELDEISPSFCAAKWQQVTLHLQNGHTHSCHHPQTHKMPLEEIEKDPSALHNTEYKKQQRKLMLEGKRPEECSYCWKVEDTEGAHFSDRIKKSSSSWARKNIQTIKLNCDLLDGFWKDFRSLRVAKSNQIDSKSDQITPN